MDSTSIASLGTYLDLLLDAVCVVDPAGRFVYISAGCERIFGYTQSEMIGSEMIDLVHPDDRAETLRRAAAVQAGHDLMHFENRYVRKDGSTVHIMWSASWSETDQVRVAVARDVTAQRHAAARQAAMYAVSDATHRDDGIDQMLASVRAAVGALVPSAELDTALHELVRHHADETSGGDDVQLHALADGVFENREVDHELVHFVLTQVAGAVSRRRFVDRLQRLALYDSLTQLPNRELLADRLERVVSRSSRGKHSFALLYVDLDDFKVVNDTLGHAAGDRVLVEVAERLARCVRGADTVSRVGGDEFVILLEECSSPDAAADVGESIRSTLAQPFEVADEAVVVLASVGVAASSVDGPGAEDLLRAADAAMYAAKALGGNRVHVNPLDG